MMAKKKETKPFYDVKHDYDGSLKEMLEAAGGLYRSVTTLLDALPKTKEWNRIEEILRKDIDAFKKAAYGDDL